MIAVLVIARDSRKYKTVNLTDANPSVWLRGFNPLSLTSRGTHKDMVFYHVIPVTSV